MKTGVLIIILFIVAVVVGFLSYPDEYRCDDCNIILIIPDTLAAKHMSWYGYARETTPFIDDFFGNNGIAFEHAFATAPWTLPSFTSIWFSRSPDKVTFNEVINGGGSLPSILRSNNINVRGVFSSFPPRARIILETISSPFESDDLSLGEPNVFNSMSRGKEALAELSDKYQRNGERFFLTLHNFIPHDPYDPPEEYQSLFGSEIPYRKIEFSDIKSFIEEDRVSEVKDELALRYDQKLRLLDDQIRFLIEGIPADIREKTIFIFTSDHGEAFGEHGKLWHANSLYNEVLHVPLFIRFPERIGRIISQPVSLIDIAPTILDIFNIEPPISYIGISLLSKEIKHKRSIESVNGDPRFFPKDKAEYIPLTLSELDTGYLEDGVIIASATSTIKWPIKTIYDGKSIEQYDIAKDPYELINLWPPKTES